MVIRRYCIQNVKDRVEIQVYNIIYESVYHSSQFISVGVKKNLRKSQAQFREKLIKLRLRQNKDFLFKKMCMLQSAKEDSVPTRGGSRRKYELSKQGVVKGKWVVKNIFRRKASISHSYPKNVFFSHGSRNSLKCQIIRGFR